MADGGGRAARRWSNVHGASGDTVVMAGVGGGSVWVCARACG